MARITYQRQESGDGYIVYADGDRLGWISKNQTGWHAADTFMVGIRRPYKTRANAVAGLLRRSLKQAQDGRDADV